ncbi:S-layer homology domain-containing protein [Paenibacillus sp. YIM B09110]|uniref:S-layer homology domain-containing protein n=1 Tax=Paenibacillus sp. YIM B09110 TaxID=3126102 RepID=UPI00301C673A
MKFRKLSILLALMLCLSLVPVSAYASSSEIELNPIAAVEQGDSVVISGTTTLTEVIVKVLRPSNSVLFYDIVQASGGQFSVSFTLAGSEAKGTYKVVAGQADQVDTVDFVVKSASTGGGGEPIGTITPPETTPDTRHPVTPGETNANPVVVDTSNNVVDPSKDANGRVTNIVKQDDAALAAALAEAARQDNHGDAPIVYIAYSNKPGEGVQFNLSAAILAAAAQGAPDTIVSLQTMDGEYSLPLSIIDFAALAQSLGTTLDKVSIQVNISTVAADINAEIKEKALDLDASQLGVAIQFTITVAGNGKSIELNQFGSIYVDRNIVLGSSADVAHSTVVLYDPLTGQFSFVPATFGKQKDGSTKITFKRNGNSIYTALSLTRTFNDISSHWANKDIELLASKLIVNGVSDNEFAPNKSITRAEFAALLVRSLGLSVDTASSSNFKDVSTDDWFAGAIGAAVKAKLVEGYNDNSFKPNDTITREQMAVMVARAITAAGKSVHVEEQNNQSLAAFTDHADISSWAQKSVAQSIEAKIITGRTDGSFAPSANATRAEAVVMLKRLLQYAAFIN